jgi:hypothetical protein
MTTTATAYNGQVGEPKTTYVLQLEAENAELRKQVDELEDKQQTVRNWIKAYPLDIFPEPDFSKVRELLANGGITLDAVSASNMRHVLVGIEKILDGV